MDNKGKFISAGVPVPRNVFATFGFVGKLQCFHIVAMWAVIFIGSQWREQVNGMMWKNLRRDNKWVLQLHSGSDLLLFVIFQSQNEATEKPPVWLYRQMVRCSSSVRVADRKLSSTSSSYLQISLALWGENDRWVSRSFPKLCLLPDGVIWEFSREIMQSWHWDKSQGMYSYLVSERIIHTVYNTYIEL